MKTIFTSILILCVAIFSNNICAQIFTNYTIADGLVNNSVNCLAVDANDHLWFGTQEGISKFDGTNWANYTTDTDPDLVSNTITAITVDSQGNLWAGTDFGVSKYDGTNWITYTESDGLADNRVFYIKEDLDGNIWFGNNDGVSVFDGSNWTSYTSADGLPFGGVNFIALHENGNKWLGTGLGGVRIFDGNSFSEITEDQGLLNDKVRSIAIDEENRKWIGTSDGISVYGENDELLAHHTALFELPPPDTLNPVEDVQIDSKGNIWAGIYVDYLVTEGGISMYDGTEWVDYDVNDGLIGPVVRRLAIDSQDNVWVATSTGISKIGAMSTNTYAPEKEQFFKLYPNPVSSVLNIELGDEFIMANKQLKIYNNLSQLVFAFDIPARQKYFSFPLDLSNGVYFVEVGNRVRKIVVN